MILATKTDGVKKYTKEEGKKILAEDVQRALRDEPGIVLGKCADDADPETIELFEKFVRFHKEKIGAY